jgi:hypothetical protein
MSEYVGADFIRQSLRSGGSNDSDSNLVTQSGRLQSIDGAAQSWRVVRVFRHQPDDAGLVLDYSFHERVGFRAGAEIVDLESLDRNKAVQTPLATSFSIHLTAPMITLLRVGGSEAGGAWPRTHRLAPSSSKTSPPLCGCSLCPSSSR